MQSSVALWLIVLFAIVPLKGKLAGDVVAGKVEPSFNISTPYVLFEIVLFLMTKPVGAAKESTPESE
jgi:hypothetical protein